MSRFNKKIIASVAIACLLFSFVACNRKVKTVNSVVLFDTIQVDETHYWGGDTSKLSCNLRISFIYPVAGLDSVKLKKVNTYFIENVLSESFGNLTPREATNSYLNQYIKNFEDSNTEDFSSEDYGLEDEEGFIYYQNLKNEIIYNKHNLVSFVVESHSYEGGAHGSHSVYGYVIDTNTGELLNEENFAGNEYKKNLAALLLKKIEEANGVETTEQLENLGYIAIDELAPNGNFTLDDEGITYYFNEYEIAAYFIGITKVFIPYSELRIYITEDNPVAALAKV
jgi:hypothetical protein